MSIQATNTAIRYAVALASVAVILALKAAVPFVGEAHPFVLLSLPIIVSAYYGGFGPGIVATLAAVIGADVFFIQTPGFGVDGYPFDLFAVCIQGVIISVLVVTMKQAGVRAHEAAVAAEEARRSAAVALQMREELLSVWAAKLDGPVSDFATIVRAAREAERAGDHGQTMLALDQLQNAAELMRRTVEQWRDHDRGVAS